jgi:ATP-dependent DNA helicase RecG
MPSALETLVKILKLERDQGYKDTAVIGGLAAFAKGWVQQAHQQARKEEHHLLVDDISQLMEGYAQIESDTERHEVIGYMLDRVMKRRKAPRDDFQPRHNWDQYVSADNQSTSKRKAPPPAKSGGRGPKRGPSPSLPSNNTNTALEVEFEEIVAQPQMDLPPEPRLQSPPRRPRPALGAAEQADLLRGLTAPVTKIKGIGKSMGEKLARLKTGYNKPVETVNDMLAYYPVRYDDYTKMLPIARLEPDSVVTVIGAIRSPHLRRNRDFAFQLDDGSAQLDVIMFGQKWLRTKVRNGDQVVLSGKVTLYRDRLQMANPELEPLESDNLHTRGIIPVYRLTEGLNAKRLRTLMRTALNYWAGRIPDYVPEAVLDRNDLADLGWALENVHFPDGWDHLHHAQRRLTFDDLLLMQLALLETRYEWQSLPADSLEVSAQWLKTFLAAVFPYELTDAQYRAINEILDDMARDVPMNRLVQGDVGSGKTAVAITALAAAVAGGKQAALMAPTSILAEQHYQSVSAAMAQSPTDPKPRVALLTGSLKKAERDAAYAGLADGSIDVVVGTQALIQEGLAFYDLGLVVVDEMHRFGVEQRGALRAKGATNPHFLETTATPIPRTLALVKFADMDVSRIDQMPPGRTPVETTVREPSHREYCYDFIKKHLQHGRQAFIVYPLVEPSESIDAPSAVENYGLLQDIFYEYNVGLLHGKMRPQEKDEIMAAFAESEYDVLVTTSVAEVGVNIPNATVMMIEGANRFGLSQLHQFRGRVGRGEHRGYCLLLPDKTTDVAEARLQAMTETTDGFVLAERDFELRGSGDPFGLRQSGGTNHISFPDKVSPELADLSHREARTLYAEDPRLEQPQHALLRQRMKQLQDQRTDLS